MLSKLFVEKQAKIEDWFANHWQQTPPPISSSVDLRNSKFKIAPVDTNLFPAGFNNINPKFFPQAVTAAKQHIISILPNCKRLLLIAESHTRSSFYFASLFVLRKILTDAGFEVRIGSIALSEPVTVEIEPNPDELLLVSSKLLLEPLRRVNDRLQVMDFDPDLIILNNDLSEGHPEIFKGLTQPINPPPQLGWHSRLKTEHFGFYAKVCAEFAELVACDPWLINPLFTECDQVNFKSKAAEDELITKAEELLAKIQAKYAEYKIPQKPFIVVKSNSGTYGMAVTMIESAEELKSLNRKQRKRMSYIKGNREVDGVILQEGIYTSETCGSNQVAEPVIYMLGQHIIGGFYRGHEGRGKADNLNAPGMHFDSNAFSNTCLYSYHELEHSEHSLAHSEYDECFYSYGVIARLALLAAAKELAEIK